MPLAPAIATVRDSSALGFVVIVSPFKFSVCEMHNHRHCVAVCQTQQQHLPMQHLQTKCSQDSFRRFKVETTDNNIPQNM